MTHSRLFTFLPFAALAAVFLASASQPAPSATTSLHRDGWIRTGEESNSPFLLKHTDAHVVVTGPVAHTVVIQNWENPNSNAVDGLYVFPLPDNAAVTAMRLRIGARTIEAEMHRREEARAIYEKARTEGRVAGLLDQERTNVFAQRVANILPGVRLEVRIELDQEVRCDDGDCSYVFPTVVGPRFVPARQGDPGEITPPVVRPEQGTGQTVDFTLDLDAGVPVSDVRSPSHRMTTEASRSGRTTLHLEEESGARLDRDVEVRWRLGDRDLEYGVLAWRDTAGEQPGVFTLYVVPPVDAGAEARLAAPRELVFVLDCSGSMSGMPIEAAKNVVRKALQAAHPADTIQILRFSDSASGLWPAPVAASPANVRRALGYLDTLQGEGGTEMLEGIRAALSPPADPERLRLVAFLTDGYIGNEAEILGEVRRLIGAARLFSFGIGSSVNRYLLENLAAEGRGAAAFLASRESPDALVARFVERIATPVFTDLRLSWEGIEVEDQEPASLPDLFAGQPLVIHGRYRTPGAGALTLEGRLRGQRTTLRRTVTLPAYAADHEALGRLWARSRIDRLTRESYGHLHPDAVAAVTDLGLRFHLMTPYTSLVAVDDVVSNRGGSVPVSVPVETPDAVSYEGVFGTPQQQAMMESLRSLGYIGGGNAAAAPAAPPSRGRDASVWKEKSKDTEPLTFHRIVLVEADGSRVTVEKDGEVWLNASRTRRLVRTLTSEEMEALRTALGQAAVMDWPAGDATGAFGRSRLAVLLTSGETRSVALPPPGLEAQRLLTLLRSLASGD